MIAVIESWISNDATILQYAGERTTVIQNTAGQSSPHLYDSVHSHHADDRINSGLLVRNHL